MSSKILIRFISWLIILSIQIDNFDCRVTCTGKVLFVGDDVQESNILEIVEESVHYYDLISWFNGSRTVNWQMSGVYKFNQDFVQTIRVEWDKAWTLRRYLFCWQLFMKLKVTQTIVPIYCMCFSSYSLST